MINRILKGVVGLFLLTAVLSCNSDDNSTFEKSSSERLKGQEAELREVLESSEHGWKLVYFTDDKVLGGYTHLIKFDDQKNVTMVSDFSDETLVAKTSEYEIQLRATTSLVFVTNNHIHALSDPWDSPVETGKGYKGEFQFGYYGTDGDEITFRTVKSRQEIKFIKATAEDWTNITKHDVVMEDIFDSSKALFRSLEVDNAGSVEKFDMFYNPSMRFFDMSDSGNPYFENDGFGVAFTADGIIINPAIEVGGETISNFKFESTTGNFVSTESNSVKVSIKYIDSPTNWTDDYKKALPGNLGSNVSILFMLTDPQHGIISAPNTSKTVRDAIIAIGQTGNKFALEEIDFIMRANQSYIMYTVNGQDYVYFVNMSDGNGYLKLQSLGWNDANTVPQSVKDLNALIFGDPKGLYVKVEDYRIRYSGYKVITFFAGSSGSSLSLWQNFGNGIITPF